ncbi:MAG: hypothetical protein ACTSO2_13740 [Promethearchaeota archaeon]
MSKEREIINYGIILLLMGILLPVAFMGFANQKFYDFRIANTTIETKGSIELFPAEIEEEDFEQPSEPVQNYANLSDRMVMTNITINSSKLDSGYDFVQLSEPTIAVKNNEDSEVQLSIYVIEALWNETAGKMYPNMSSMDQRRTINVAANYDGFIQISDDDLGLDGYTINNDTLFIGINSTNNNDIQVNGTANNAVGNYNNFFVKQQVHDYVEEGLMGNVIFNYTLVYMKILYDYNISTSLTPYPKLDNETHREIQFKITEFQTEVLLNYTNFSLGSYLSNNISFTLKSSNPSVYESETYDIPFESEFYTKLNVTIYRQYLTPQIEPMNISIYQIIFYEEYTERTDLETIFSLIPVMIILSLAGLFLWKREGIQNFIEKFNK